jgi:hypothetical protein
VTTLTIDVPKSLWLSLNDRTHWAEKARRTRALRCLGYSHGGSIGRQGTSHVAAFIAYPRNGKADPANAASTVKALIDGMVDAGVWIDDDSTQVIGPTYLRDPSTGVAGLYRVRLVLTPQEVPWT